jgi:hypothetical protein
LTLELWIKLFVDLLKDISWELTLLVSLFYFRKEIKALLNAIVERGVTIKAGSVEARFPLPTERPTAKLVEDAPQVPSIPEAREKPATK